MKGGMALDIGSSNTYIYQKGAGIVLEEPTCIAFNGKGKVKAIGKEAKRFYGLAVEDTQVVFPVFEGGIADKTAFEKMLYGFLRKVEYSRQKVVVSVPCGMNENELGTYKQILASLDLYDVSFVESPLLSAIGMGILSDAGAPRLVINIGGGSANVGVVSLGGIIAGVNVNLGGQNIDSMLVNHLERVCSVKIGMVTSESLKNKLGSLFKGDELTHVVSGRDLKTGSPRPLRVSASYIYPPIKTFFDTVINVAEKLISALPPEALSEINRAGAFITGGVAQLAGLKDYFEGYTGMRATIAQSPEYSNILGAGKLLSDKNSLNKLKINL